MRGRTVEERIAIPLEEIAEYLQPGDDLDQSESERRHEYCSEARMWTKLKFKLTIARQLELSAFCKPHMLSSQTQMNVLTLYSTTLEILVVYCNSSASLSSIQSPLFIGCTGKRLRRRPER